MRQGRCSSTTRFTAPAQARDSGHVGHRPVGGRGGGDRAEHVVARLSTPFVDIALEGSLEEGHRVARDGLLADVFELLLEPGSEAGHVLGRDAEEVGDHEPGER